MAQHSAEQFKDSKCDREVLQKVWTNTHLHAQAADAPHHLQHALEWTSWHSTALNKSPKTDNINYSWQPHLHAQAAYAPHHLQHALPLARPHLAGPTPRGTHAEARRPGLTRTQRSLQENSKKQVLVFCNGQHLNALLLLLLLLLQKCVDPASRARCAACRNSAEASASLT
jgi:hypothetical protein